MADHDPESNPGTAPFVPDFSDDEDTGTHSWVPDFSDDTGPQPAAGQSEPADGKEQSEVAGGGEPGGVPVQSVTVPGRYQYLKWWKLLLVILGVWFLAAEVGLGLCYWWYHAVDKTAAVYVVLVYVVACTVGAVMLAMVQGRPLVAALSLALMSGPFASLVAAAPLDGYYHCARLGHCLIGVIPY
ncbi:hypothetical protein [Mycobacterium sp. 050134]|uniref:hypothetical protein n=1 Tax=Mycobacterium sp. 050134 TaxID=3096111 RepID=UPI002ED9EC39